MVVNKNFTLNFLFEIVRQRVVSLIETAKTCVAAGFGYFDPIKETARGRFFEKREVRMPYGLAIAE